MIAATERFESLPGWELVSAGLADAEAHRLTPEACGIWIAFSRLRRNDLVPDSLLDRRIMDPEAKLYDLLCQQGGNAFGRYNAFLRRLVRFEHALDRISVAGG
jgi:hypothetical protein